MNDPFEMVESIENDVAKIKLFGEVDLFVTNDIKKAVLILLDKCIALEIDLSSIKYMDSSGISTIIAIAKIFSQEKKPVIITGTPKSVRQIFELINFADIVKGFNADNIVE